MHTQLAKWQTLWLCQLCIMVCQAGYCRCYIKYACRMPSHASSTTLLPPCFPLHMAAFSPHTYTHTTDAPNSRFVRVCACEVNWFLMRITQIKNNFIFIRLGSCDWHIWLVPGQKETNKSVARQTPSEANKQREQFNSMKLNFCMVCHLWLLPPTTPYVPATYICKFVKHTYMHCVYAMWLVQSLWQAFNSNAGNNVWLNKSQLINQPRTMHVP